MTKWARMRKRKERGRVKQEPTNSVSEGNETKPTEQEKTQKLEIPKTSKSNPILSQIPRYVYLVAIFVLLSGVFFPLITIGADEAYNFVIGGAAILFLGLAGGILLFKGATSDGSRGVLLTVGFILIAISIALIFLVQEWWKLVFVRG